MIETKSNPIVLSIVIVNYNTANLVSDCLKSIKENPPSGTYEVIAIDNASRDGSVKVIKNDFRWVKLIRNTYNHGFGVACNQGIRRSKGKYVLLLNSDTRIIKGALNKMLEFLDKYSQIGMAGGKMVLPNGKAIPSVKPFPNYLNLVGTSRVSLFNFLLNSQKGGKSRALPHKTVEVEAIAGGYLFIRREALNQVGLMDERFFMYMEDVDLALRMKKAGWKVVYYPHSEVIHILEGTSSKFKVESFFYHHLSLFKYFQKNYSHYFLLNYILCLGLIVHFLTWLFILIITPGEGNKGNQ